MRIPTGRRDGRSASKRRVHLERVPLIDAEDDGLGETARLDHESGQMTSNGPRPGAKRHLPLESAMPYSDPGSPARGDPARPSWDASRQWRSQ